MIDLTKVEELYTQNFAQYGFDSRSVGWNSPESQTLRFEKLLQMVPASTAPFTINELGCGYGEMYKYMQNQNMPVELYNGYDISEKMLDAAKQYLLQGNVQFYKNASITTEADYTTTSGIFNVKFDHQMNSWEDYIKSTLHNMFDHSRIAISFNLLSKYVDFEAENLYYADPTYFFDYCKKNLSKYVSLIHDYNLYEWTIIVRK